jgi:calpain-15
MKYPSGFVVERKYNSSSEVWKIDNQALSNAEFILNLEECENCTLDNAPGETSQTVIVGAQQKNDDIKITKTPPWSFAAKFSLRETPVSLEEQKSALKDFKKDWDRKVEESENAFKKIPYEVLPFNDIIANMALFGQSNFIDPHFPPRNTSIYNVVEDSYPFEFEVHWRRPHEFMENPVVFENDIDPNDIRQGQLGDCWFLSALSSLAERPGMVRRLFITQEYNKEGIYQIKI